MTLLLLMLASLGIGWFTWDWSRGSLDRLDHYQQTIRLRAQLRGDGKAVLFPSLLAVLESPSGKLEGIEWIRSYSRFLDGLIRRAQRTELKAGQILSAQLASGLGAALFFGALSQDGFLSFLAFLGGFSIPLLWLRDQALLRERKILKDLPTALETISLCSEAGLSLEQGLEQYLVNSPPSPLRDEFKLILDQVQSGSSRKDAFRAVSGRLDLVDFSIFTVSLIQAERFGSGIAQTLRQLSLSLRDKQSQRAEKAVQEMPVKMLFPLILFILPVTFLMIFGPIFLQWMGP